VKTNSRNPLAAVLGPIVSGSTWRRVISACMNPYVMIIPIVVVSVGLSLAAGLAIFVFPESSSCWPPSLHPAVGRLERARLNHLLDAGSRSPSTAAAGQLEPFGQRFTSAASWKEVLYWPVQAITGSISFARHGGLVGAGVFIARRSTSATSLTTAHLLITHVSSAVTSRLCAVGSSLLAAPWSPGAHRDGRPRRGLLGAVARTSSRSGSTSCRPHARAVDSAEAELRRIERDLHDGAQAVSSHSPDLGMAREKMTDDPSGRARRGPPGSEAGDRRAARPGARIHPAVLADRGLDPALSSLVSRVRSCQLTVDVPERPPASTESIAYFVVAEALTNITKHANASAASVSVVRRGQSLVLEITDDGVGGADMTKGTGLAGLADRVSAVDGYMDVSSPLGGPTIIVVELPCES
jgi:signal transduction histidine kinase